MKRTKKYLVALLPLLVMFLSSCTTVPETGRSQLLLIGAGEEMQLGLSEFQKLKQSTPISKDANLNALVQRVGERIAKVAPLPNAQWEFVLFDDAKTANAFCLPGGKVGIYTGILPITRDEAGLATVIGHEIAHAVARHGGERLSQGLLLQLGGVALDTAMKNNTAAARQIAQSAYGIGGQVGVALPHSRSQESEADHIGLMYMARAGYDPREAVDFWKRFAEHKGSGGQIPFLSTHPVDAVRIAQLESLMPQAEEEFRKSKLR